MVWCIYIVKSVESMVRDVLLLLLLWRSLIEGAEEDPIWRQVCMTFQCRGIKRYAFLEKIYTDPLEPRLFIKKECIFLFYEIHSDSMMFLWNWVIYDFLNWSQNTWLFWPLSFMSLDSHLYDVKRYLRFFHSYQRILLKSFRNTWLGKGVDNFDMISCIQVSEYVMQ
jgi:hypothetical protein